MVKLIKRNFSLNVNHKILSNFNNFNSLNISDDYIKSSLSSSSRIEICISNPKVFSCSNLVNDQQKYYSYKTECSNDFILSNVWLFTSNENLFKNFCIDRKKRFENILNSSVSSYFNKFGFANQFFY